MKCSAQHGIACLPVTALHTIHVGDVCFLLHNEGSSLSIKDAETGATLLKRTIFRSQNIHGIVSYRNTVHNPANHYALVIWGGRLVCTCVLTVKQTRKHDQQLLLRIDEVSYHRFQDWVVTIVLDPTRCRAIVLTAHNALWALGLDHDVTLQMSPLVRGTDTLLYSGALSVMDNGCILVASGTIFGEVLVWTCVQATISVKHIFLGHEGSVFGVAISEVLVIDGKRYRMLASCSDDRTIRLWDISDCERSAVSSLQPRHGTGFGVKFEQHMQLAMAWGHLSRIWGVCFLASKVCGSSAIRLVSRGEDGSCQYWEFSLQHLLDDLPTDNNTLNRVDHDRHHAGKNVWSLAVSTKPQGEIIYTGGADGQLISRYVAWRRGNVARECMPFANLAINSSLPVSQILKQYLVLGGGIIVATTSHGSLVQSCIDQPHIWSVLSTSTLRRNMTLCTNTAGDLVFYSLADGTLSAYDLLEKTSYEHIFHLPSRATWIQVCHSHTQIRHFQSISLVINLHDHRTYLLSLTRQKPNVHGISKEIVLPSDFLVTSSLFLPEHQVLLCGSRAGALAVFHITDATSEKLCPSVILRHAHGSETVTSIMMLPKGPNLAHQSLIFLLTTGRDGSFAVHCLDLAKAVSMIETLHRGIPPLGSNVEGAHLLHTNRAKPELLLYGFKSTDFIVWNESQQTQMLAVDCGGAHRSWGYASGTRGVGTFVWTKAGTFNFVNQSESDHYIVQRGSHGREIKALALTSLPNATNRRSLALNASRIIATGAEDTDIRLFTYQTTTISQIAVLKGHTTGLQAVRFSECNRYLFSSGGVEEFTVWKLNTVPVLEVGSIRIGVLPKTGEDDDARIMAFDILEQQAFDDGHCMFTIVMAYSTGKAKTFEFLHKAEDTSGQFKLLQVLTVGTLCLTQIHMVSRGNSLCTLIAATDGHLRFTDMDTVHTEVVLHQVHQSNVASMAVRQTSFDTYIIATGGDDNALAITIMHYTGRLPAFHTVSVPKAHAAALTAVTIVDTEFTRKEGLTWLASAGNDQMVRLWRVSFFPNTGGCSTIEDVRTPMSTNPHEIRLEKMCQISTDVADVTCIETLKSEGFQANVTTIDVLVVGVGMQTIQFSIER